MIWINDWNDIIRHVIFSDKELMNLMTIPKSRMIRHARLLPYRNQQVAHQKQVTRRLLQRLQSA